jgi:hypothetical protein
MGIAKAPVCDTNSSDNHLLFHYLLPVSPRQ